MGILYGDETQSDAELYKKLHEKGTSKAYTYGYSPFQGFLGQMCAVWTHNVGEHRLKALKHVPSLVITGTKDYMVRPSNSHEIARILEVEPIVLDGRGHHLVWECTDEINRLIHDHTRSGKQN